MQLLWAKCRRTEDYEQPIPSRNRVASHSLSKHYSLISYLLNVNFGHTFESGPKRLLNRLFQEIPVSLDIH